MGRTAVRRRPRLIPACAGKTPSSSSGPTSGTAHPRVCGENPTSDGASLTQAGSSPRVRGKLERCGARRGMWRLIPACAGKTGGVRAVGRGCGAHPRVCGENSCCPASSLLTRGSSPRVRGKLVERLYREGQPRLIPACAGKTPRSTTTSCPAAAHPRVCGENAAMEVLAVMSPGSSPRVRGKRVRRLGRRLTRGLIPACAGKTPYLPGKATATPAHPRACGENPTHPLPGGRVSGSSPRVRGKHSGVDYVSGVARLIPARAGKTGWPASNGPSRQAHPRACGENLTRSCSFCSSVGSSPRVRGKRRGAWAPR